MDAPVVAAVVSSSVAVFVAVASAVRADLQRASDRRYERRRAFLVDAQDAALALRDALRAYGAMLQRSAFTHHSPGDVNPAPASGDLGIAAAAAEGRLDVAVSRVEDANVRTALQNWLREARVALIDVPEQEASLEQDAFAEVNRLISSALQSSRGRSRPR